MARGQAPAQGPVVGFSQLEHRCCRSVGACRFQLPGDRRYRPKAGNTRAPSAGGRVREQPLSSLAVVRERSRKLYEDYRRKGVTLVAINPNNPNTVGSTESITDVTDSLPR